MITRHRNRSIFAILGSVALVAAGVFLFVFSSLEESEYNRRLREMGEVFWVIAFCCYIYAGIELAWAKGYQSAEAPGIILISLFCVPCILPLMPLIVLFGLPDKEPRNRWH